MPPPEVRVTGPWHMLTVEHHLAVTENEISPFSTRMDLEGVTLSEVSQRQTPCGFSHRGNLKNKANKQTKQNRNRPTDVENKLTVA